MTGGRVGWGDGEPGGQRADRWGPGRGGRGTLREWGRMDGWTDRELEKFGTDERTLRGAGDTSREGPRADG